MNPTLRIIVFGIIVWAIPFIAGMLLFPLKAGMPAMFDTLMAITVCAASCVMGLQLLKTQSSSFGEKAVLIGLAWAVICIAIDLPIFTLALDMDLLHYMGDIGLIYLMLPIILWALAGASRVSAPQNQGK